MDTARTLATLASEGGMQTFNTRMTDLQNMLNLWQTQDLLGTNQSNIRSSNTEGSANGPLKPTESRKETKKRRKVQRDIDKDFDDISYRKRDFGPITRHGQVQSTRCKKKVKSNKDPNVVLVPATTSAQSSATGCSGKTIKSDTCTQPRQKSEKDSTKKALKDVKMP